MSGDPTRGAPIAVIVGGATLDSVVHVRIAEMTHEMDPLVIDAIR